VIKLENIQAVNCVEATVEWNNGLLLILALNNTDFYFSLLSVSVTVKKRDCNFSVKIKVLNFPKKSGAFLKFSKIHEFNLIFLIHKIRIINL